jgi:hypothetical protein
MSPEINSELNPTAVTLARVLLMIMGALILIICAVMFASGAAASVWAWAFAIAIGVLCLVSAFFDSATGSVASIIILFFPIS